MILLCHGQGVTEQASAERVAQRFLVAGQQFRSLIDFDDFMREEGARHGWKPTKPYLGAGYKAYRKRYGAAHVELFWDTKSAWSDSISLLSKVPKNIDTRSPEYEEAKKKLHRHLGEIRKLTWREIEAVAQEVAAAFKFYSARQKKDRSGYYWKDLRGDAAYKQWLVDISETALRLINSAGRAGRDYDTAEMVDDLINNHVMELEGMSRREMSKTIARILNTLAKQGKIEKDTNDPRRPRWVGLDYRPEQRSSW